jgi:hypothetical protein
MIPQHVYYQLAILGLLWLCVLLHYCWRHGQLKRTAVQPQSTVADSSHPRRAAREARARLRQAA